MTDPLNSVDPLASLFLPRPEDRTQPAVFLTGEVLSVGATEVVTVEINGTPTAVSVCSTVTYADLVVGASVALLGIKVGGLATYMAFGVIETGALRNRDRAGLRLVGIERHTHDTSDGDNWLRDDHPGIRAIYVETQAAGGTGGGSATAASGENSAGGGGGYGGLAGRLIFRDRMEYAALMTIPDTTAPPAAGGTSGNTGGTCAFGTLVEAAGGLGGGGVASGLVPSMVTGGLGGAGSVGDNLVTGAPGHPGWGSAGLCGSGSGGSGKYGAGGRHRILRSSALSQAGADGIGYGAGGGGAASSSTGAAAAAGAGAAALIVVWLYG